jgi:putative transposase
MVGARVRRQQVAYALGRSLSSRRACALLSVARSTLGYQSRLAAKDAPALTTMRELAGQYPGTVIGGFGSSCSEPAIR